MFAYFIFLHVELVLRILMHVSSDWVFFLYTFCVNLTAACLLRINGDFIKQHFAGSAIVLSLRSCCSKTHT
jgi:hypothetical protein